MERGGHGLPKVSPGPAMLYLSMPCGWAIPKTALRPFQGWPAHRTGGLQLSYLFGHPTLYAYAAVLMCRMAALLVYYT
jgi:hypothetical protein